MLEQIRSRLGLKAIVACHTCDIYALLTWIDVIDSA